MPNVLMLAYVGDAVYELYVRDYLVRKNFTNMKNIQKESLNYVSASSQRRILEELINNDILTTEEIDIVKSGRNAKGGKSKNADIVTYRYATGFEYLIGYLHYNNNDDRISEIMKSVLGE